MEKLLAHHLKDQEWAKNAHCHHYCLHSSGSPGQGIENKKKEEI